MSTYTRWYREGTVSATSGSNVITGTNTYWETAGLNTGDILKLNGSDYEILTITDNTHMTIAGTYTGSTVNNTSYAIVRNFTATMPAKIAAQVSGLLNDFTKYIDTDMQSIHGKSAYEVAKANGYTGTAAEWLESLKAAGEWSKVDARTSILDPMPYQTRNTLWGGRKLGTAPTAAQYAAIKAGTFDGMFIGDYWQDASGQKWRIAHFNYYKFQRMSENDGSWAADPETGKNRNPVQGAGRMPNHVIILPDTPYQAKRFAGGGIDLGLTEADNNYLTSAQVSAGTVAYFDSNWYKVLRPLIWPKFVAEFGESHLLEWRDAFLVSFDSAGLPSGYVRSYGRCEPMWAVQQFGYHPSRTEVSGGLPLSRIDTHGQFALYNLSKEAYNALTHQYYRDVVKLANGSLRILAQTGMGETMLKGVPDPGTLYYGWRPYAVLG